MAGSKNLQTPCDPLESIRTLTWRVSWHPETALLASLATETFFNRWKLGDLQEPDPLNFIELLEPRSRCCETSTVKLSSVLNLAQRPSTVLT